MYDGALTTATHGEQLLGPHTIAMVRLVAPSSTASTGAGGGEILAAPGSARLSSAQSTATWGLVQLEARQ